jgi:hypothetical protein
MPIEYFPFCVFKLAAMLSKLLQFIQWISWFVYTKSGKPWLKWRHRNISESSDITVTFPCVIRLSPGAGEWEVKSWSPWKNFIKSVLVHLHWTVVEIQCTLDVQCTTLDCPVQIWCRFSVHWTSSALRLDRPVQCIYIGSYSGFWCRFIAHWMPRLANGAGEHMVHVPTTISLVKLLFTQMVSVCQSACLWHVS